MLRPLSILLSTLLLLLTLICWIKSEFDYDQLFWTSSPYPAAQVTNSLAFRFYGQSASTLNQHQFSIANGALILTTTQLTAADISSPPAGQPTTPGLTFQQSSLTSAPNNPPPLLHLLGFGFIFDSYIQNWGSYWLIAESSFMIPFWFLTLLFLALPFKSLLHYIESRNTALVGHCKTCHYDLRASHDRCPECGTPIPSTKPTAHPPLLS